MRVECGMVHQPINQYRQRAGHKRSQRPNYGCHYGREATATRYGRSIHENSNGKGDMHNDNQDPPNEGGDWDQPAQITQT